MCLKEITNDEPINKGFKIFCDETESSVYTPFYVKNIPKGKWIDAQSKLARKLFTRKVYRRIKNTFTILGKKITLSDEKQFYEAGFHVFHTREDAEKYITDVNSILLNFSDSLLIKWLRKYIHSEPKSRNFVIKEVLVDDIICVGRQNFGKFDALTTVSRKIYVL